MKTWVLLLGCSVALAGMAHAAEPHREIWVWTDANGVKHYSDSPAPGARRIEIAGQPNIGTVAPKTTLVSPARPAETAKDGAIEYSRLEIWAPDNGATFFGADAVVNIRLRSEPELGAGDRLLTYLDGKLLPTENAYEHVLSELDRGVHSVTSVILDPKGNEKIRSEPLVFHIKEPTTVTNPRNVGPSLRPPPPKPQPKPGTGRPGG